MSICEKKVLIPFSITATQILHKKGKKPSGEQQRRIPLPGWTEAIELYRMNSVTELQHIQ